MRFKASTSKPLAMQLSLFSLNAVILHASASAANIVNFKTTCSHGKGLSLCGNEPMAPRQKATVQILTAVQPVGATSIRQPLIGQPSASHHAQYLIFAFKTFLLKCL